MNRKSIVFSYLDCHTSLDDKILSSDLNYLTTVSNPAPYHTSLCGSILYSAPTKSSSDIFAYLRHGNFDAFRQSFDLHYNEIVKMKNQYEQVSKSNSSKQILSQFSFSDCIAYPCDLCLSVRLGAFINDARLRSMCPR